MEPAFIQARFVPNQQFANCPIADRRNCRALIMSGWEKIRYNRSPSCARNIGSFHGPAVNVAYCSFKNSAFICTRASLSLVIVANDFMKARSSGQAFDGDVLCIPMPWPKLDDSKYERLQFNVCFGVSN